jgi:SAM-dependent methyltransferase
VLLSAGCLHPGAEAPDVRTAPLVVTEMLRLAAVTSRDVVYDLGSGDGRLVIGAAQQFGARGVGVEIDPTLVAESRRNAQRARVEDRVRFLEGDLFQLDLREATVVTLYLGHELNLRLRPKLLAELRPGSRIVSHDFDMGDWKPERVLKVLSPEREHVLYLWTVPAR